MLDNLAIISRIINEHQTIRGHVKLVGDSVSDEEAMERLERVRADFSPGQAPLLSEKHDRLRQTMAYLDEGLRNHFAFEEKFLPPLLGELIMRALVLEHSKIASSIDNVKAIVAVAKLEGLGREELIARESRMQQAIYEMCHLVEEHAAREETVLGMVQRGLQDKEQK